MVEVVVFGGSILCIAAGMAVASSFHEGRREPAYSANDDYYAKSQHHESRDLTTFLRQSPNNRKHQDNYEFWNTVDSRVLPSFGIMGPDHGAGPYKNRKNMHKQV
jgi:hypothetical protein